MIENASVGGERSRSLAIEVLVDDRDDAVVAQRSNRQRPGRDRFSTRLIELAEPAQNPLAGAEGLLGMAAAGQHRQDQSLGVRSEGTGPASEALGRPFRNGTMVARHMIGGGAVGAAAIAPLMGCNPLALVENFDRAGGDAQIHLFADQPMRHRIEELVDLDMVVGLDAREFPLGILVILRRQGPERGAFDALEELPAADPEPADGAGIERFHHLADCGISLGEREERAVAQAAQD